MTETRTPRTVIAGRVISGLAVAMLTLDGTIATHLRLGNPLFSHVLSGVYVPVLLWGGLYLRDARVRALIGRAS